MLQVSFNYYTCLFQQQTINIQTFSSKTSYIFIYKKQTTMGKYLYFFYVQCVKCIFSFHCFNIFSFLSHKASAPNIIRPGQAKIASDPIGNTKIITPKTHIRAQRNWKNKKRHNKHSMGVRVHGTCYVKHKFKCSMQHLQGCINRLVLRRTGTSWDPATTRIMHELPDVTLLHHELTLN